MSYDLIASFIQHEMNIQTITLKHFPGLEDLLTAIEENNIDIIIFNSSCLFDGSFREKEIRRVLDASCGNKHIITVFFAQNMKSALLKKMLDAGVNIVVSLQDRPQELIKALAEKMTTSDEKTYISQSVCENLQQECTELTPKEWEVINLIREGYSLSEIASKKCRAMSTISTQKRNAMNKLHLRNENELLLFLHQNEFF
ncbi:LuxR C-terminal-related transcriptional regulator [Pantoea deleyi]|uniref:LuxR C-terminal-related transcriptional regulator n=1 Tax=Pantoea deleyi TaxID=470932 RepID=UPI002583B747|nr:LuxR C-terminal-related transcriptional regulator [uncultured Pantoea sp.]